MQEAEHRAEAAELQAKAAEAQALVVQAENERKTNELEEARQLQLSMLPTEIPQLAHLDIAAYMNPATEVGGDYYDFHLASDGTLTVAVGDATGHGLNAGMMVTAAKSLFETLAREPDTVNIMNQSNHVIRQMNFATLKMAICYLKISGNRLCASGAGMPPLLIYRQSTNNLKEIVFEGMPLGSLASFPYEEKQVDLFPGDKIILMSDGFPERLNQNGEMLDYPRAYQAILAAAIGSPKQIIRHLVQKGENWANGRPQDDDVTFVVIEVKEERAATKR
jgi:serine phosphatase RsbU (regulator of sigma subunit)